MKLEELNLEELRKVKFGLELLLRQELTQAYDTEDEIKKYPLMLSAKRTNDIRGKIVDEIVRQKELSKGE